jgi:hypothetical protein
MNTVAVIDGIVCVAKTWLDMTDPVRVVEWLPTIWGESDLRAAPYVGDEPIAQFAWEETHPGHVFIGLRLDCTGRFVAGDHTRLADGAFTQPVLVERVKVPPPKVRRGTTVYWTRTGWIKRRSASRPTPSPSSRTAPSAKITSRRT